MSFKLFIYYFALCGGWAAFLPWALRQRAGPTACGVPGEVSAARAYAIARAHPGRRRAPRCIPLALEDAGLHGTYTHYSIAHGTSTSVND